MPSLLRLSEATALGLHACAYLATQPGRRIPVVELTRACRASNDHMTKVCQRLTRARLLAGRRGQGGGFVLAVPASRLRLARIYETLEGPIQKLTCLMRRSVCVGHGAGLCVFGEDLAPIQARLERYLRGTTVAQVAARCRPARPARRAS